MAYCTAKERMKSLLAANPQNLTDSGRMARWPQYTALGRLSEIKVPTLIIVGEADIPDVQARTRVIQEGIAGSRCIVLTQSGHLAHFEVPEIFNRVVLKFLKSIE